MSYNFIRRYFIDLGYISLFGEESHNPLCELDYVDFDLKTLSS